MPWKWDPDVARYRDDAGQFMAEDRVLEFVNDSIDASEDVVDQYSTMVTDGTVSPAGLNTLMREEIKEEYIRQYLLGIGGRPQMTPADWGSIGGMLKEQYGYLTDFVNDIIDEELSEAQIRQRAQMYINSAGQAYEKALQKSLIKAGYDEVRWIIDEAAENCPDCQEFEKMGWQTIADDPYHGSFPKSGDTECLTNCACRLEYRKSSGED